MTAILVGADSRRCVHGSKNRLRVARWATRYSLIYPVEEIMARRMTGSTGRRRRSRLPVTDRLTATIARRDSDGPSVRGGEAAARHKGSCVRGKRLRFADGGVTDAKQKRERELGLAEVDGCRWWKQGKMVLRRLVQVRQHKEVFIGRALVVIVGRVCARLMPAQHYI